VVKLGREFKKKKYEEEIVPGRAFESSSGSLDNSPDLGG